MMGSDQSHRLDLSGVWTALVTPFGRRGVDTGCLRELVERMEEAGLRGIVVAGTTGEAPALEEEELELLVKTAIKAVRKDLKVMVGVGSNNTKHTIERAGKASEWGADALLVVTPYYNKPTPEGLKRHFLTVAEATDRPIVLYHIPGRTGVGIPVSLVAELSHHPRIIGIKEAGGEVTRTPLILAQTEPGFSVLSGDDPLTLPLMAVGAIGVISVISHLVPITLNKMVQAALAGDVLTARSLNQRLLPLYSSMFLETNPAPIKAALNLKGIPVGQVRPPLAPVSRSTLQAIKKALKATEDLN